jgi:hypothetical protein
MSLVKGIVALLLLLPLYCRCAGFRTQLTYAVDAFRRDFSEPEVSVRHS